jgi:hypothetical protein
MPKPRNLKEKLLSELPVLVEGTDWRPVLRVTDRAALADSLGGELSQVGELTHSALAAGRSADAVNWLYLGMLCDQAATRKSVSEIGALRPSKYRYRASDIRLVVDKLQLLADELLLTPSTRRYLDSIGSVASLSVSVRRLDQSLREFIKRNGPSTLKSVLARVDALFMLGHRGDQGADSALINHYSAEELAEGASYIVHCLDSEVGISQKQFSVMSESKIKRGVFDKLLIKACKIKVFCDAEIMIDAFDYGCEVQGASFVVAAPYPELEKSTRLGYMQNEQASERTRLERQLELNGGATSVFDLADAFFDEGGDFVVRRNDHLVSRYTFWIPDAPPIREMFASEAATVEEQTYIRTILASELISWEELRRFEAFPGVSILDLSRVFRLFLFLSRLAQRQLSPLLSTDPDMAYRSLVPVFRKEKLHQVIGLSVGQEKIDPILEWLVWKPGSSSMYDMQYRPFIEAGNYYAAPMHVAGMTNWYRNLAYLNKRRVIRDAGNDAASKALAQLLTRRSEFVRHEYETKLDGERIELDVICRFGDFLFIFESKDNLLPCNPHELRTSFKAVHKGAEQLSRAKHLISKPGNETELYRRLGWEVGLAKGIATCIVSCNGMYSGLRIDGNPVRRFAELANMIETGIVNTANITASPGENGPEIKADDWMSRCLWNGSELTADFLHDYLERDTLRDTMFDAMIDHSRAFDLGDRRLVFSSYALDLRAAATALASLPGVSVVEEGEAVATQEAS